MSTRVLTVGLGLLAAVGVALLLLSGGERGGAPRDDTRAGKPPPHAQGAPLEARGSGEAPDPAVSPATTEDAFLESWAGQAGVPMGDDTLHGVVVDARGDAIPGASVWLRAKPGQPAAIDHPGWVWNAYADAEGKWQIEHAWGSRSTLGAWAEGYEPSHVEDLAADREIRVVLEKSPTVTVTVQRPKVDPQEVVSVAALRVRVRSVGESGHEYPRVGERLQREWEVPVELGKPAQIPVPRDQPAHLMAGAWEWACEPAFHKWPAVSKELEFTLVPTAVIALRLLDAETGEEVKLQGDGSGYWGATHVESGFQPETRGLGHFASFVAVGEYEIEFRYRGYKTPSVKPRVRVERPDQQLRLDLKLPRDMSTATLHVVVRHHSESKRAEGYVETGGLLLARRRESEDPRWSRIAFMEERHGMSGVRHVAEELKPGTYDLLVWGGADASPAVGVLREVVLAGGDEKTVDVALEDGYGFRAGDVVQTDEGGLLQLRAESKALGVLPWIGIDGSVYMTDAQGFVDTDGSGYIGAYPQPDVTIVQRMKDGTRKRHPLKPAIRPPPR